jgi:hypothetical protein
MGGMGVFFRVAVGVVHPVEDRIGAGIEKRRTLGDKRESVKEPFPKFIHLKHLVRRIAMQEEGLREKGQKPVGEKKQRDNSHNNNIGAF